MCLIYFPVITKEEMKPLKLDIVSNHYCGALFVPEAGIKGEDN